MYCERPDSDFATLEKKLDGLWASHGVRLNLIYFYTASDFEEGASSG